MRDPEVERAADDRAARLERPVVPEVLPEAERDRRQQQPAAAGAAVVHPLVAVVGGHVRHRSENVTNARGHARSPPLPVFGFNTGFGRLAQLVERLLYTQVVGGSSPSPPIEEKPR